MYIGLQFTDECFCGNVHDSQGEDDISACDADGVITAGVADLCANGNSDCSNHNAVYKVVLQSDSIAYRKPTSMSSNGYGSVDGSRAVDGNLDTEYAGGSCTHTGESALAWWQVDLGALHSVETVSVYHRTDCCRDRLIGSRVVISDQADYTVLGGSTTCFSLVRVGSFVTPEPGRDSVPETGSCEGRVGRYLTVVGDKRDKDNFYMTICEFEVAGVLFSNVSMARNSSGNASSRPNSSNSPTNSSQNSQSLNTSANHSNQSVLEVANISTDVWNCGESAAVAPTALSCGSDYAGCAWAAGGCVQTDAFPESEMCCSRGGWARSGGRWTQTDQRGGWVSSFADVTMIYGGGTAGELDDYLRSDDYLSDGDPLVAAAIIFKHVGHDGEWGYSIRLNSTLFGTEDVPTTEDSPVNYLQSEVLFGPARAYVSGDEDITHGPNFVALQLLVDRYILQSAAEEVDTATAIEDSGLGDVCPELDCEQLAKPLRMHPYRLVFTAFPFGTAEKQDFYEFIADYLALIFVIIYMYSVFNATQTFILEKESKVREALRMQGVGNAALVTSWFVSLGSQYVIMSLLMAIASKASLFAMSDFFLLLLGFSLSLFSFLAFALAVHTLFDKARTGGLFSVVVFAASYPIYRSIKSASTPAILRFVGCLHPGTACCFLIQNLGALEGARVGVTWESLFTPLDGSTYGGSLGMLVFDTALFTTLGWYLDLALPKEFGIRLSPGFFCRRSYWQPRSASSSLSSPVALVEPDESIEGVSAAEAQLEKQGRCIAVRGLRKEFKAADGTVPVLVAVDRLDLTMYEGQIFALLGHNGAGKTTTLNMLSGLYSQTAGTAFVYGRNISTEMDQIRKQMGNCFQHDVLYPTLTVGQHLALFAGLKGILADGVSAAVTSVVEHVGLQENLHVRSSALSGGMKRKLSLSIALIGGPTVLYLDVSPTPATCCISISHFLSKHFISFGRSRLPAWILSRVELPGRCSSAAERAGQQS